MKKIILLFPALLLLANCSTVMMTPHSLDKTQKVYVDTNGERMRMALKQELSDRGYDVTVGTKSVVNNIDLTTDSSVGSLSTTKINGARYVATVQENPIHEYLIIGGRVICMFNGWKWWDFSVSIADNKTGKEILNWSGMGCKGTTISKLRDLLDELEK